MARIFGKESVIQTSIHGLAGRLGERLSSSSPAGSATLGERLRNPLAGRLGGLSLMETETSELELDLDGLDDLQGVPEGTMDSGGSLWRSHLHIGHACAEFRKGEVTEQVGLEQVSPAEVDATDSQELGRGASGTVMRATIVPHAVSARLAGKPVAVKVVNVGDKAKREQLVTEVNILLQISQESRTLINCYGAFVQGGCVHVVLEYMDWSLSQVKRDAGLVPSDVLPLIMAQILDGLYTLHSKKVLHRDVKCGNILVNKIGEVKVTDFGISKSTGIDDITMVCKSFVGTLSYMSPERLMGEVYSYASDIWSVGIMTYELASGTYPYGDFASFMQLSSKVCTEPVPDLPEEVATPTLQSFLGDCLQRDANDRKDAQELLQHELIAGIVSPERCCKELVLWLEQVMLSMEAQQKTSDSYDEMLGGIRQVNS